MIKARAKQAVEDILNRDFKYLCKKQNDNNHNLHLTFLMDSQTHNLQMSFEFKEKWCDVLCFISPTILKVGSENYLEALLTVN
jgi:ssRNA-specific RNase YbeY (16S rRNA maturation enzyme)